MSITEFQAKSLLRKHKKVDSWFVSQYGMNFYRGCHHNCVYCDGRAEGYYVDGEFGDDVAVKINAPELLRRELDPKRKRKPMRRSFLMLGGGVGDSYQPAEKQYGISRQALHVIHDYGLPVHILTKSTLVERDLDLIKKIDQKTRAIVSFSLSSADDEISRIFEPGVPSPSARFDTLQLFKNHGIACGLFLLPVIPFITDTTSMIESVVRKARTIGIDFIIFGGMTLKRGRQQDHFMRILSKHYPALPLEYEKIYPGYKYGEAIPEYYKAIAQVFDTVTSQHKMPKRIPVHLFRDILEENDLVTVILEQLDYLLRLKDIKSPFGYAAYAISRLTQPISSLKSLREIKGVGEKTEQLIQEIINTRTSSLYEKMLKG